MKSLVPIFCSLLVVFLIVPESSNALNIEGIGTWGIFTGTFTYTPVSGDSAVLVVELTNDSPPENGGYLTGFAFNNPGGSIEYDGVTFSDPFFLLLGGPAFDDTVNCSPYGHCDIGAALGGSWQGDGDPADGIGVGETKTFTFEFTGEDLNTLDEWSFVNELSSENSGGGILDPGFVSHEWFVVRFHGFDNEESDKVPGDVDVPVTLSSFAAAGHKDYIEISWTSQTEVNAQAYYLLRSEGAEGQYTEIARIEAQGNSEASLDYRYVDRDIVIGRTYYYQLVDVDYSGQKTYHGPVFAAAGASVPGSYNLMPNYPNPFNPSTAIGYAIPQAGHVTLTIYNVLGQEIRYLVDADHEIGTHTVVWDSKDDHGRSLKSGVYFYTLEVGDYTQTRKMVLMR